MPDRDDNQPPFGGTDEGDAGSGLVLPGDEGFDTLAESFDEEAELEVDERQQEEIRRIFGTSFPQYLQPVGATIRRRSSSWRWGPCCRTATPRDTRP